MEKKKPFQLPYFPTLGFVLRVRLEIVLVCGFFSFGAFAALHPRELRPFPNPVSPGMAAAAQSSSDYLRLEAALASYRQMAKRGGWPAVPSGPDLSRGDENDRVAILRRRLLVSGELAINDPESQFLFDPDLEDAVKKFQRDHSLAVTGELDSRTFLALNIPVQARIHTLELNLERWRWLPRDLGSHYVLVDIAGFRVIIYEDGRPVMTMKAIVGGKTKETPIFWGEISQISLNPWWKIPRDIALHEVLPELKTDLQDVVENKVEAGEFVRGKWKTVKLQSVDWSKVSDKNFHYSFRQAPGPVNPLGAIKFIFPNQYSVYLHGTIDPELFESDLRAVSHGCVRVQRPIDMALSLLRDNANGWTEAKLREVLKSGKELTLSLSKTIPVYFDYFTTWVDENKGLQFRNDVYGWDDWDAQLVNTVRFGPKNKARVATKNSGTPKSSR